MGTISQQLDNRDTPPKVKGIQQIGLDIRVAVFSNNTEMSWPPKPCEMCENVLNIPPELDGFARSLLTGNTEITTQYPHRVWLLVNSFGQDIIYGVTWGRQKPPKQILLPYAVKTLQTMLNLFRCLS